MAQAVVAPHIRLDDFEKFHVRQMVRTSPPVTLREVLCTLLVTLVCAPFFFATFFLIPMMGQVTVGLAALLTALYLWFRRSLLVAFIAVSGAGIFSGLMFAFIQSIKMRLDVPLFILIALGIPVTAIYSIFIAGRIWILRGGVDEK
jgi:hypothetical protein